MSLAAALRSKLSHHAAAWVLHRVVMDRVYISRVAAGLNVAWNTANTAVLKPGKTLLINKAERFAGVTAIEVDEHVWAHTRAGPGFVTVIIDLTPSIRPVPRGCWT